MTYRLETRIRRINHTVKIAEQLSASQNLSCFPNIPKFILLAIESDLTVGGNFQLSVIFLRDKMPTKNTDATEQMVLIFLHLCYLG